MDLKAKAADAAGATLKAGGGNDELKSKDSQSSQELVSSGGHAVLDLAGAVMEQGAKGGHSHQRSNRQIANQMLVNGNDGFSQFQSDNGNNSFHQPVTESSHASSGFQQSSYDFGERGSSPVTSDSGGQKRHNSGYERLNAGTENQSYLNSGGSKSESLTLNAGGNGGRLSSGEDGGGRLSAGTGSGQLGGHYHDTESIGEHKKHHRSQSRLGTDAGQAQLNTGENTGQLLASQGEGKIHLSAGMGQDDFKLESGTQHLTFQRNDRLVSDTGSRETLYMASKRKRQKSIVPSASTDSKEGLIPNEKKLRDNRKKLQKKLRAEYEIKTELKGGLKSDLRLEQSAKSKLYDAPRFGGGEAAADFGKKMLHMADDAADDKNGTGIQNAWIDTADKAANASSGVMRLSRTARYHRMRKNEAQIAKLARQQDRLMLSSFRLEYRSALRTAREGELWKSSSLYEKYLQKKAIKRKYMKNAIKEYQRAKKVGAEGKTIFSTGFSLTDKAKSAVATVWEHIKRLASSPLGKIAVVCTLVLGIIVSLFGAAGPMFLMSFGGNSSPVMGAGFPPEVEAWREFVVNRCSYYAESGAEVDLNEFVNAILATIQQESGGVSESCGGDIMQCKACGNWESGTPPDWDSFTTEQKSIDAGVRYFYSGMKSWGVTKPDDYDGLQMVAQGYNYGYGFLTYAKNQGATKWTLALSQAFADSKGGNYGHPPYGEEWLAKYMAGGIGGGAVVEAAGASGVMQTAQNQIGISENPAGSNNVIFNTDYYGQAVSGDDYPWCCAFVWWCFNKSGNGAAFYNGGKTASCQTVYSWAQTNHLFINGSQAQYGDIVLFGSNEHIELVVCKNDDGSYTTIGGNTSSDEAGSQSNGGCVALKRRYTSGSFPITSFIRPPYSE